MSLTTKQTGQKNQTQLHQTQQVLTQLREVEISPHRLFSPRVWYNADNVIKDGSNLVSQMNDLSGHGDHLQQGTAADQPLWVENELNGQPVIRFDGSNDFLYTDFEQSFTQPNTLFTVFNLSALTGFHQNICGFSTPNECSFFWHRTQNKLCINAGNDYNGYSKTVPFNYQINTIIYDTPASSIFENGSLQYSGNLGVGVISDIYVGSAYWSGSEITAPIHGNIAEIILYDRLLSNIERQNVENYLMNKYGLS